MEFFIPPAIMIVGGAVIATTFIATWINVSEGAAISRRIGNINTKCYELEKRIGELEEWRNWRNS